MADIGSCIPSNPDISGIGVRIAIYAQNMLSFGPAMWALWDGKVSVGELDSIETQSMTILITAFAILVSAIVQALTLGLSNFHASIILDLSWMNNTSTFIYFLLYIRHKTQDRDESQEAEPMDLKWSTWRTHVLEAFHLKSDDQDQAKKKQLSDAGEKPRSLFKRIFTKFVLIIGSVHLSLMAAIGLWLWSQPRGFSISQPCSLQARLLFGYVPIGSSGLRIWSTIIYSAFLLPFFNLVLPTCGFLALHIYWPTLSTWFGPKPSRSHVNEDSKPKTSENKSSILETSVPHVDKAPSVQVPVQQADTSRRKPTPSLTPTHIGLAVLFIINVFFVIDIETTISRSTPLRDHGDSDWTFGQTLALLLLLVPLRDLVETILDRREARLLKIQHDRDEYMMVPQLEKAVKARDIQLICSLAAKGALLNVLIEVDGRTRSPLSTVAAAPSSTKDMVEVLLGREADVNMKDTEFGTPLIAAVEKGSIEVVQLLLRNGAELNIKARASQYPTALQMAAKENSVEMVKLLLEKGADPNVAGGYYHTALQVAAWNGSIEIVGLLLNNTVKAKPNIKGGEGSALHAAVSQGHKAIVRLLLDHGADPNLTSRNNGTALQIAIKKGKMAIVATLLRRNAKDLPYGPHSDAMGIAREQGYRTIRKLVKKADRGLSSDIESMQSSDEERARQSDEEHQYAGEDSDSSDDDIQSPPQKKTPTASIGKRSKRSNERGVEWVDKEIVEEPGEEEVEPHLQVEVSELALPELQGSTPDNGDEQPVQMSELNKEFVGGLGEAGEEGLRAEAVEEGDDESGEEWIEQPPQVENPGYPPSESRPPTPGDGAPMRPPVGLNFPPEEG